VFVEHFTAATLALKIHLDTSRVKVFYLPFVPRPTVQSHCNCFAGLSDSTEVQTTYNNEKKYPKHTVHKVVEYTVLSTV